MEDKEKKVQISCRISPEIKAEYMKNCIDRNTSIQKDIENYVLWRLGKKDRIDD